MLIRNDIDTLSNLFDSWIGNKILDYKIVLLLNSRIEIHFLVNQRMDTDKLFSDYEDLKGLENLITFYQIEFEEEADREFFEGDKVDLGLRRRLTNFIVPNVKVIQKPCPVVTFYSYKGGTGRTTSLAFFASWLATHHGKKVVIIDCDFEAPGLTNYFDITEDRKGIVEYLLDSEYDKFKGGTGLDIKKDYAHQVRYEYVGKGDIFIIPAGNLSNEPVNKNVERTFRADYLEALARLDITSVDHIVQQFESFFKALQTQLELDYENSVIIFDSRTGFNDTFAVLSTLSDIIVGFFGINKQSQVGITQFLDTFGTVENNQNKQILLVNSISEDRKHESAFKEIINKYISDNGSKFTDEELGKKDFINNIFRIPRVVFLGKLGTSLESDDKGVLKINGDANREVINIEFHAKVQRPDSEFEDFFKGVSEKISFLTEINKEANTPQEIYISDEIVSDIVPTRIIFDNSFFESIKNKVDKIKRRERILRTLVKEDNFPKAYADNDIPSLDDFFFRDCLKDIFNRDKFIIVGYKGTGKTHIYQSFKNKEITNSLCKREKQNVNNFIFVNVIPVFYQSKNIQDTQPDETSRYFDANTKFSVDEIKKVGSDYFFERFWLAYIWNELFTNVEIVKLNLPLSLKSVSINNDNDTAQWFRKVIADNTVITGFERDLKVLDKKLKDLNKAVILSFDQLDFIVKPENWSEGIAPLLTYWRNNIFSKIYPKIFVRADIFENRLSNITNFNELKLEEKTISLQWSKQELFAYFFKYVFKASKEDFFALSYAFNNYPENTKNTLLDIEKSLDSEDQLPLENENFLRFLVIKFFGKFVNVFKENNAYGESYDWFFSNLTDAKGAISIRPFLDLIQTAIELALEEKQLVFEKNNIHGNKILSPFYYINHKVRAKSAERYYNDLAKDKGNEPLFLFADFLKYRTNKSEDKQYEFSQVDFNNFLSRIINKYPNDQKLKTIKHIDDFRHLLINNGIVKTEGQGVKTKYIIPFLYRSYFDVGNPEKKMKSKSF